MNEVTVYMPLLEEGIEVSRPVRAMHLEEDVYLILEQDICPTEVWLFPPGTSVHCERIEATTGARLEVARLALLCDE